MENPLFKQEQHNIYVISRLVNDSPSLAFTFIILLHCLLTTDLIDLMKICGSYFRFFIPSLVFNVNIPWHQCSQQFHYN